jgi:hypothetical protein
MAPWEKGRRHKSWAKNGNVAVTIFFLLFSVWVFFQVWQRLGGGAAPVGLDPMVMAALGVAITTKSVEKKAEETEMKADQKELKDKFIDAAGRIWDLEELARLAHPEVAEKKLEPQPKKNPGSSAGGEINAL